MICQVLKKNYDKKGSTYRVIWWSKVAMWRRGDNLQGYLFNTQVSKKVRKQVQMGNRIRTWKQSVNPFKYGGQLEIEKLE